MDTSNIQETYPIGTCLDSPQRLLSSLEQEHGDLESIGVNDLQDVTLQIAAALLGHPASKHLPSVSGTAKLRGDIVHFITTISSAFDFGRVKPLLVAVLERKSDQELWDQVYKVVTESTPTPQPTPQLTPQPSPPAPLANQTPRTRNTGYIYNSSQQRASTDGLLKEELGVLYVDVPDFHKAFLSHIPGLEAATDAIFKECQQRASLHYLDGKWVGWPDDANQNEVLEWLATFCDTIADMAKDYGLSTSRQLVSFTDNYLESSTPAKRKLDVGFVDKLRLQADVKPLFSDIDVLGELKCNPKADTAARAWFDNARYVREVFASQDNRRFVSAFTLCGSYMRVWKFDRIGGIGSTQFDINADGARFLSTLLGFLTMGQADLGYDPTIQTADDGRRFIEINRNNKQERLILHYPPILRIPCIVGRATTCWKAYSEEHPEKTLVIKDSWQHPERDEEGDLLRMASMKGVTNVAKYYYHTIVQVGGRDDDILHNVRKNLDISPSRKARPTRRPPHKALLSTAISRKRDSSPNNAMPPSKRLFLPRTSCGSSWSLNSARLTTRSVSLTEATNNRVHRRVVLCDYGIPIYKASSRVVLLTAFESCIRGHKSLLDAHLLHRDISINNLMIDEQDPTRSFLIDLDLAIDLRRTTTSGSRGITGTLAFMAIGALWGKPHTFRHDLESFFWVLFWICVHYPRPSTGEEIVIERFEAWNYMQPEQLAILKQGYTEAETFNYITKRHFTPFYQPLVLWVDKLRERIFVRPVGEDRELYDDMLDILRKAREDPQVAAP